MEPKLEFLSKEYLEKVYSAAMEVFCQGIYVKSKAHPCGWDFIDFCTQLDCSEDMWNVVIDDISFGDYYDGHPYSEMTVKQILKEVGEDGWCFERGSMPWCD